jgi:DNA-binding transcriptional LysR family regulator
VELFHRSRGGVRLTEAGQTLLPRIRRALSELDAGREEIGALTGLQTGRVRLGAMQALGTLDLPRVLAEFHLSHPGVEVMLQEAASARMQELVATDQLDLAIVALDAGYPAGVVGFSSWRSLCYWHSHQTIRCRSLTIFTWANCAITRSCSSSPVRDFG